MKEFSAIALLFLIGMAKHHPVRAFSSWALRTARQNQVHSTTTTFHPCSFVFLTTDSQTCQTPWRLFSTSGADDGSSSLSSEKKRVVFLGTPDVAAESLRAIVEDSQKEDSCYEVVGVVTQPPKRRKRKGKVIPSPVGFVAEELDIPVLCPDKAKDPDFLDDMEHNVRPDLCITAAYGQYLPKRFLATPTYGTVNIHPSLLPRWRGASPVQRSLEANDNPIGVSVLFTVSKMDAGPIISQEEYEVGEDEQATTVLSHLFDVGTDMLLEAIPDVLNGKMTMETATTQDEEHVVNADMINPAEAELKLWKESATTVHNRVRGFSIWPGTFVYTQVGDNEPTKTKIVTTRVLSETAEPTNSIQLGPKKKDGLRFVCHDGSILEVLQLQPVTKKVMDAKSFVNGLQGRDAKWIQMPEKEEETKA
mmetsp:Transcript_31631/g.48515  ORF Transcript_31631/g.48515 Transcript_31631/m.48515 type:complete len:420 (-) Transcript_31631:3-1262(-)